MSTAATHTPGGAGPKSKLELTDQQSKILELIRKQGKVDRDSLITSMKLSEAEVDAIATTLLRAELAKIVNEGGKYYLVSVPYSPPEK